MDLIVAVLPRSGGQGGSGVWGGGAARRRSISAAAGHWELAGLRRFGVPGLKTERSWVREVVRIMANPTGHTGKGIWVLQELTTVRGGEGSPVTSAREPTVRYPT